MPETAQNGYDNLFLKLLDRAENNEFVVNISNKMQYDMTMRFVGQGLYFWRAQVSFCVAREVGHILNLNGVIKHVVRQYVQARIAVNMQGIRHLLFE